MSAAQEGPYGIGGQVISASALAFASDFVEFYLTPAGATTVTVQDLANTTFPNEQWQIIGPGLNTGVQMPTIFRRISLFRMGVSETSTS